MPDSLQQIVQRMIAAGESEDNIAIVIRHYNSTAAPIRMMPAHEPTADTRSYPRAVADRFTEQVQHLAGGIGAGAASTVVHTGDLIRRGLGLERVIDKPDVQRLITPPDSSLGRVGFYGEQGAEFGVPLTKLSTATKGMGILARLATEGAASAGVAGLQSGGDPSQMATAGVLGVVAPPIMRGIGAGVRAGVGAAQRAAAGASEGGLGGAVAAALRTGAPLPAKSMIVQALKPRATQIKIDEVLNRALPELKATEEALGRPIASIDDLLEATTAAKVRVRAQYDAMMGPQKAMGSTVDLSPVAKAMIESIPSKVKLEDPGIARAILDKAAIYRNRFSITDAEQLLKETNAELQAYYGKYPAAQRAATTANPEIAHLVEQAKALRTAIYETLDAPGQGAAARELQRRYGALMEVEDTAIRRANVAKRQQPESLAEQFANAGAIGDFVKGAVKLRYGQISGLADMASARAQRAAAKYIKEQQTTDKLIERAFAAFKGSPAPVTMPPATRIAGLLNKAPILTPPPAEPSTPWTVRGQWGARVPPEPPVPPRQLPGGPPPQGQLPPAGRVIQVPPSPLPVVEGEILPQRGLPPGPPERRGLPPAGRVFELGPGEGPPPPMTILKPGDTHTSLSLAGKPLSVRVKPHQRVITAGPDSAITLEVAGSDLFVNGIHVAAGRRGQGLGTQLYDEALKLAEAEGKTGLLSARRARSADAERLWDRFRAEGRVTPVQYQGETYERLTAAPAAPRGAIALPASPLATVGEQLAAKAPQTRFQSPPLASSKESTTPARVATFPTRNDALMSTEKELLAVLRDGTQPDVARRYAADELETRGIDAAKQLRYRLSDGKTPPPMPKGVTSTHGELAPPAPVKPAPPSAPVETPAAAATEVRNELRRVVDLEGAKSAGDVFRRVVTTLQGELESSKTSAPFKSIEFRAGKAYGGREGVVMVDGEPLAMVDRYGKMTWDDTPSAYTTAQGKYVPAGKSSRPDIGFNARDMTPSEHAKAAQDAVAGALHTTHATAKITIDIPGDGTFTIQRDPRAIQEVLTRINRGGPSPWQGLVDKTKRPTGNKPQIGRATW